MLSWFFYAACIHKPKTRRSSGLPISRQARRSLSLYSSNMLNTALTSVWLSFLGPIDVGLISCPCCFCLCFSICMDSLSSAQTTRSKKLGLLHFRIGRMLSETEDRKSCQARVGKDPYRGLKKGHVYFDITFSLE